MAKETAQKVVRRTAETHRASGPPSPDAAQVQSRAYEIYQERISHGAPGDPVTDWLRAEDEVRNKTLPPEPHNARLRHR